MMNQLDFLATKRGIIIASHKKKGGWQELSRHLTDQAFTCVAVSKASDPIILAGTKTGIFRSDYQGQQWQPANSGLLVDRHIRWLAFHPNDKNLALTGTEPAAIFISQNGGENWQECPEVAQLRDEQGWSLPYSPEAGCVRGFALHGNRVYAAVEQGGLLRSDDAGQTWRLIAGNDEAFRSRETNLHPDVHSVEVHPHSADQLLAATGGGLYHSNDGGVSWQRLYRCYCRAVWWDPDDPTHMIFGPADSVDRNGRLEESTDGGRTWHDVSHDLDTPWPQHMVERFAHSDGILYAVLSNGRLLASPSEKLAWQQLLPAISGIKAVASVSGGGEE